MAAAHEVTTIVVVWSDRARAILDHLDQARPERFLQTTTLVNEPCPRLLDCKRAHWQARRA